jgi:hypothetical protein
MSLLLTHNMMKSPFTRLMIKKMRQEMNMKTPHRKYMRYWMKMMKKMKQDMKRVQKRRMQ